MELITGHVLLKMDNGSWWSNIFGDMKTVPLEHNIYMLRLWDLHNKNLSTEQKFEKTIEIYKTLGIDCSKYYCKKDVSDDKQLEELLDKCIMFFSEFDFEVSYRFINTWIYMLNEKRGKEFILNYLKLVDNPWVEEIQNKMKSKEFLDIVNNLKEITNVSNRINKRFKLYYGSQGTGKTTLASEEANGRVVVCHSAMLPSDIMEDFTFNDGKATFVPSEFCKAMINGTKVVMDEINLLPFDSLRFLQGLLDDKKQIVYKGQLITIKDGFEVIGTMNLRIGNSVYSLPEPLVDRASDLKEFKLTGKDLVRSLRGAI